MSQEHSRRVAETARYLESRLDTPPRVALMTGTGLGASAAMVGEPITFSYARIPHFPVSTVPGHAGELHFGKVDGCPLMVMQGRFHLYEGYSPVEVTYPIRVMQTLGVRTLIVTNAAGGLNPAFEAGDIMAIADHLNLTGSNPLVGPNNDEWGERFPDMSRAYDRELVGSANRIASGMGMELRQGVYAGLLGPSLETPAEIRFLRSIGADAVGLSTVHEAIAAVHAGMRLLGLSIITNTHDPDRPEPAAVEDIISVANRTAPVLGRLVRRIVEQTNESEKS